MTTEHPDIAAQHQITEVEVAVLKGVLQVLDSPHHVQELLSGEKTSTLSQALPAYEEFIEYWKKLCNTIPELEYYIKVGISKLEEYIGEARETRVYARAMGMCAIIYLMSADKVLLVNHSYQSNTMKFDPSCYPADADIAVHREWIKESVQTSVVSP